MSVSLTLNSLPVFHVVTDKFVGNGTSYWGINVNINPRQLIDLLGESKISDDYKISKQWAFVHAETGAIFTLYDWKQTSLYSSSCPRPSEIWNTDNLSLHIGHKRDHKDIAYTLADMLLELAPAKRHPTAVGV
jgi:hypothetical protein